MTTNEQGRIQLHTTRKQRQDVKIMNMLDGSKQERKRRYINEIQNKQNNEMNKKYWQIGNYKEMTDSSSVVYGPATWRINKQLNGKKRSYRNGSPRASREKRS